MSTTIGYYFNQNRPLHEFAAALSAVLGCVLQPYEGNTTDFYCRFLAMELSLGHNTLENDRDLNFEEYGYFLDVRIPAPDSDLFAIATQTMMSVAYVMHRRLAIHRGLLVWNIQAALARYELRLSEHNEFEWYDFISAKFVRDQSHWLDVLGRYGGDRDLNCPAGRFPEQPEID